MTVPNCSHALPSLPRPDVAAVKSMPASPNSSVFGSRPFDGLMPSVVEVPVKNDASAMLAGSVTAAVQVEPVHCEYKIVATPLLRS